MSSYHLTVTPKQCVRHNVSFPCCDLSVLKYVILAGVLPRPSAFLVWSSDPVGPGRLEQSCNGDCDGLCDAVF